MFFNWSRNCSLSIEPKNSLLFSQNPVRGPYLEPDKYLCVLKFSLEEWISNVNIFWNVTAYNLIDGTNVSKKRPADIFRVGHTVLP